MRKIALSIVLLGTMLVPVLDAAPAQAQPFMRTWVAYNGTNNAQCSVTNPCQTFAQALAVTANFGEVNCLTSGGFGGGAAVLISMPVTIDCTGVNAGITLASGADGIDITVTPVVLRNIIIDGENVGGNGVLIEPNANPKAVYIEDVVIMNCPINGVADERTTAGSPLLIKNATFRGNSGAGVYVGGNNVVALLENVHSVGNQYGVYATSGNNVIISRSVMSGNSTSTIASGIHVDPGAQIFANNTEITQNYNGIYAGGTVVVANSDFLFNQTGVSGTGATASYGNNRLIGNGTNGTLNLVTPVISNEHGQQ